MVEEDFHLTRVTRQTGFVQRVPYAQLHELLGRLNAIGLNLDTLSMGMSHDLAAAVLEGATIVRVGTAIFGNRAQGGI